MRFRALILIGFLFALACGNVVFGQTQLPAGNVVFDDQDDLQFKWDDGQLGGGGGGGDLIQMNAAGQINWPLRPFSTGQERGGLEMSVDRPVEFEQSASTFRNSQGGPLPNTDIGLYRFNQATSGSARSNRWYQHRRALNLTVGGEWTCRSSGPLNGVALPYGQRACTNDNSACTQDDDCTGPATCKTLLHNCVVVDGGYWDQTDRHIKFEENTYHGSPIGFGRISSSTQPGTCSYGSCTGGPSPGARCRSSDANTCGAGGTCTQPTCTTDSECTVSGSWCEYVADGEILIFDANEARGRVTPMCVRVGVDETPTGDHSCPYEDELNSIVYGQNTVCNRNRSGSVCRTSWTGATSGQPRFAIRDTTFASHGARSDSNLDASDFDADGFLVDRMPWAQFHDAAPTTTTNAAGNQLTIDLFDVSLGENKSFVSVYDPSTDEQSFLFRTRAWNRSSNTLNMTRDTTKFGPSQRHGTASPYDAGDGDVIFENERILKNYDSHLVGRANAVDNIIGRLAPIHNGQVYGNTRGLRLEYTLRPRAENAQFGEWYSLERNCGVDGQYTSVIGSTDVGNRFGCSLTDIMLSDKVTYPSVAILHNEDLSLSSGSSWANLGTQLASSALVHHECTNTEGLGGSENPSACWYLPEQTDQSGTGNPKFWAWFASTNRPLWVWDSPDGADGDRKWLSSRKLPSGRFALELTDNESTDVQSPVAIVDPLTVSGTRSAMQWDASQGRLVGYPEGSMLHYAVQDLSGYVNRSMCRRVANGYTLTAARAYATAAVEVTLEDKAVPGDGATGSALTTTTVAGTDWTDLPITTASVSGPANICVALSGTIPAGAMGVEVEGAWAPLGVSVPANSIYWQNFESTLGADCFNSVAPTDCDCSAPPCPLVGTQSLQIGPMAAVSNTRFQVNNAFNVTEPESLLVATFVWRANTGSISHAVFRLQETANSLSDSQINSNEDLQFRIGCEGAGLSGQIGPFVEDQLYNVMAVWDYRPGQKVARLFVDERIGSGVEPWGVTEVGSISNCTQSVAPLTGLRMQANPLEGDSTYIDDLGVCDQTAIGAKPTGPCQ